MATILCPTVWGGGGHPYITPPQICTELLQFLTEYVTLTFDHLSLKSCHVMPLGWSTPVQSLRWIWLTVPALGWLQFSIDRQLSHNFYVFWEVKGVKFHISNPPKGTFLEGTTYNDVLCVGCDQRFDLWAWWRKKKGQTFMRQTSYLPTPATSI